MSKGVLYDYVNISPNGKWVKFEDVAKLLAALPGLGGPQERWEIEFLTPLTRFVNRSRVKPTDEQIEWTLALIKRFRNELTRLSVPAP